MPSVCGALDAVEDDRRGIGALLAAHHRAPTRCAQTSSCSTAAARKVSPAASSTFLPSAAQLRASLPMVVVLPLPLTPMISSTNGLAPPEVERAAPQRQDLGGAPAQERPDRVGIGELACATASCGSPRAASGWCARRCRRSAAPSRSRRRRTDRSASCRRRSRPGGATEAGARAARPGARARVPLARRARAARERDRPGAGGRSAGGRRRRFRRLRARGRRARRGRGLGRVAASSARLGLGAPLRSSAASGSRRLRLRSEARGRGLADAVDHPLTGGRGRGGPAGSRPGRAATTPPTIPSSS